jgi:hypothetical protein
VCRLRVMAPSCGAHLSTVQLPSQWSSFRGEGQGNEQLVSLSRREVEKERRVMKINLIDN